MARTLVDSPPKTAVATSTSWGIAAGALFLLALVMRLVVAWRDAMTLVVRTTPDDAYYYLQIARNLANGNNVTFDGETVTNGFHPLWLLIITPVFWVTDGLAAVHLILAIGALFGAATAVLIYLALQRLTGDHATAWIGGFFFAIHPQAITHSVNGVESAIVSLMYVIVAYLFLRMQDDTSGNRRTDVAFGVACGLMILARTDSLFVLPPLFAYMAFRTDPPYRLRRLATWLVTGSLVLLPWVVWSLLATGTIIQISGVASGWFNTVSWTGVHGDSLRDKIPHGLDLTWVMLTERWWHRFLVPHTWPTPPFVAAFAALVVFLWLWKEQDEHPFRRQIILLAILSVGVIAGLIFHTGYRWQVRDWYFATSGVLSAFLVGWFAHVAVHFLQRFLAGLREGLKPAVKKSVLALAYGFIAVGLLMLARPWSAHEWVFYAEVQGNHLITARWIDDNTDEDARIGTFNAGIIGYFSNRTVVNLDGVVNADAFEALRRCQVYQYMRTRDIDYMVDLKSAANGIGHCGAPEGAYELVATVGREVAWLDAGLFLVFRLVDPAVRSANH